MRKFIRMHGLRWKNNFQTYIKLDVRSKIGSRKIVMKCSFIVETFRTKFLVLYSII